jgi:hypothetical protein
MNRLIGLFPEQDRSLLQLGLDRMGLNKVKASLVEQTFAFFRQRISKCELEEIDRLR